VAGLAVDGSDEGIVGLPEQAGLAVEARPAKLARCYRWPAPGPVVAPPLDEPVPPPVDVAPEGGVDGEGLGAGVGATVPVFVPDTGDLSEFMPAAAIRGMAAVTARMVIILIFTSTNRWHAHSRGSSLALGKT